jgi:1-acyl-sn-glycerol-3-phosphate acyltransferase
MKSLAEVTIVGMFSVVLMAYIVPPFLFRWLTQTKTGWKKTPLTIRRLALSIYGYSVFLVGCLFLTIVGFLFFGFGQKSEKRKMRYHQLLCKVVNLATRSTSYVKFNCENLSGETFEKPAVIISNHQSFLDLISVMMITPRLVVLTNDWVWHSPFFGQLIRYADFYPISNGMDQNIEALAGLIQKGYSIVVFPEGTRSENHSILRFHRGAFYLAEKLKLDIIPVFLHGVGHVLPKKNLALQQGSITIQIHPRIKQGDTRYGNDYGTQSKQLRRFYQQKYTEIAQQYETAVYFKNFVFHNYIYKGIDIERNVSRTLKKMNAYSQWIDTYQGTGPVLVVNNGLGVFSFLFALVHKQIQVVAFDHDADKVALAGSCAGIPENLTIQEEFPLSGLHFETIYLLNPDQTQLETYRKYGVEIIVING